jgi:hypothetical protein
VTLLAPFFVMLFWFGPAAALLLVSLILEQQRHAPNGTRPQGNIVLRSLIGGIITALIWFVLVAVFAAISGKGNAGLWIVATPWAFALGQGIGLVWKGALRGSD